MTQFSSKDSNAQFIYRDMDFPLNVYAHATFLEEGEVKYLHYGLFQETDNRLHDAQGHSTDLILKELPKPPGRILEVGVGLGTTLKLLTDMGYQCHGISPDREQINYIKSQWTGHAPVSCQKLEDFNAEPNSFDLILFQESAQYIDPLIIFNQALDFLAPSGSLLILDEFSLGDHSHTTSLHLLDNILTLASRFGFQLNSQQDLSALATPTLDYLLRVTQKHGQQLMVDLKLSLEQLNQLDESNRAYKENYIKGRYGYVLLHFEKEKYPKWRLKSFEHKHFSQLLSLFKQSFNESVSAKFWQWKYSSKQAQALCAWEGDTLIAHFGGIPREILYFSKSKTAVQIGDVMVHPQHQGVLTKSGVFFRMAATFLDLYIGFGKPFLLGFGFPNERAMKVAEHLGLYTEVGHMVELSWPVNSTRIRTLSCLRIIDKNNIQKFTGIIDSLWHAMAEDLQHDIVGVRDATYVQNRYLNHPNRTYKIIIVKNRITHTPYAIVILDIKGQRCDIVDIISPTKYIPLLIIHAQRLAALNHCTQLFCQITYSFSHHFESKYSDNKEMDIRIPSSDWTNGPQPKSLKNHWWLMGGDMDFR